MVKLSLIVHTDSVVLGTHVIQSRITAFLMATMSISAKKGSSWFLA